MKKTLIAAFNTGFGIHYLNLCTEDQSVASERVEEWLEYNDTHSEADKFSGDVDKFQSSSNTDVYNEWIS